MRLADAPKAATKAWAEDVLPRDEAEAVRPWRGCGVALAVFALAMLVAALTAVK